MPSSPIALPATAVAAAAPTGARTGAPALPRLPAIDGVRALAIALIVGFHYFYGTLDPSLATGALGLAHQGLALGWAAMDLFFALSGFLIGRILIAGRGAHGQLASFWIRRAFRILPPYLAVMAPFLVVVGLDLDPGLPWLFDDPAPLWSYAFAQNLFMLDGFGANWAGATWSLALEEQFYLAFPFVVLLVPVRRLPAVLVAGAVVAAAARFALAGRGDYAAYVLLPTRMDALLLGALVAWTCVHGDPHALARRYRRPFALAFVASIAAVLVARFGFGEGLGGPVGHLGFSIASALLVLACAVARPDSPLYRAFSATPVRRLATISYTLYLVHQPALGLAHGVILDQAPRIAGAADALVTGIALCGAVALAALSWLALERPALARGRALAERVSAR